MDELRVILESNIPIATAVVAVAYLMRPVLMAMITSTTEECKESARLASERNQAEREQTKMLGELRDELRLNRAVSSQTLELINGVSALPAKLDGAIDEMRKASARRDQALTAQAQAISDIQTGVVGMPAAVWKDGQPRLDAVRASVEQALAGLEKRLTDRIPANDQAIRTAIRAEMAAFTARLDEIEKQADNGKQPEEPTHVK